MIRDPDLPARLLRAAIANSTPAQRRRTPVGEIVAGVAAGAFLIVLLALFVLWGIHL